jgi:hypothetical protein
LLSAEEDAGELWPSIEVSRNCLEDDVVDVDGEFAAAFFELLIIFDLLDFDPCVVAIVN